MDGNEKFPSTPPSTGLSIIIHENTENVKFIHENVESLNLETTADAFKQF
jgi:hypothetical protein